MGGKSWLQLQHWQGSHGQMCHFSCLAEKLKWSFLLALSFMVCCSIIKKKSIKLQLIKAGPQTCLCLDHPRQVLAAVPECRRSMELSQLTNKIFCSGNPAYHMAAAWLSLETTYGCGSALPLLSQRRDFLALLSSKMSDHNLFCSVTAVLLRGQR